MNTIITSCSRWSTSKPSLTSSSIIFFSLLFLQSLLLTLGFKLNFDRCTRSEKQKVRRISPSPARALLRVTKYKILTFFDHLSEQTLNYLKLNDFIVTMYVMSFPPPTPPFNLFPSEGIPLPLLLLFWVVTRCLIGSLCQQAPEEPLPFFPSIRSPPIFSGVGLVLVIVFDSHIFMNLALSPIHLNYKKKLIVSILSLSMLTKFI